MNSYLNMESYKHICLSEKVYVSETYVGDFVVNEIFSHFVNFPKGEIPNCSLDNLKNRKCQSKNWNAMKKEIHFHISEENEEDKILNYCAENEFNEDYNICFVICSILIS